MSGRIVFTGVLDVARKILYWFSTGLIAALGLFSGFAYLSAGPQAVQGFTHVGYPQQLRVLLGIAKPLGAIALIIPGWPIVKEWAYAGFAIAWIAATVAHYLAGDGGRALSPVVLLILLVVSYVTRSDNRRISPRLSVEK